MDRNKSKRLKICRKFGKYSKISKIDGYFWIFWHISYNSRRIVSKVLKIVSKIANFWFRFWLSKDFRFRFQLSKETRIFVFFCCKRRSNFAKFDRTLKLLLERTALMYLMYTSSWIMEIHIMVRRRKKIRNHDLSRCKNWF